MTPAQTISDHIFAAARHVRARLLAGVLAVVAVAGTAAVAPAGASAACANPVACENALPGDPATDWQVVGAGDSTIQGFATSMSVNVGQTESFKIKTPSTAYHIDILRLGYYQGNGARRIAANIKPTATLPQSQPACLQQTGTGLIDCGNWAVSASWTVPSTAVSGLYVAHLVRDDAQDPGGDSQILFVVRNDASHSDVLVQTSDATWEAYNAYGGNSLYTCTINCPSGNPLVYKGADAVSYNRPLDGDLTTDAGDSDPYYAEYQLIRFLEQNGYDLSYTSESDVDASGALLKNHKVFISSGHDEYWSAGQRASVASAQAAGVNLAFFSGNEMFWKTRWGPSIDGSNTPYRTLTTYKETHWNAQVDPQDPPTWTGAWADPRFSPPADGGNPANALTGQQFSINSGSSSLFVPSTYSKLRFWRNTAVARLSSGQTAELAFDQFTVGYEWDLDEDNGFRPAGEFDMSSTPMTGVQQFTDYGSNLNTNASATHHLTLYRASSGALVFATGTVQWSWGLDITNAWGQAGPDSADPPDASMQQATVNVLADMGAQPGTLMSGLAAATASTDTTAPTSAITSPSAGATVSGTGATTISGTATDAGGGVVAGVEVSTDGGSTWHPATISGADAASVTWSYSWVARSAPATTIMSRAVDDSGNIEKPSAGITVNVSCPCSLWSSAATPGTPDSGDVNGVTLGMSFTSDTAGTVTGVRFYKATANTGTHVGALYSASGTLLASATFAGETASGWQQVTFSSPVSVAANTTYIVAYYAPKGHYSADTDYWFTPSPTGGNVLNSSPVHAVPASMTVDNGWFAYGTGLTFPSSTFQDTNYWVDVLFQPGSGGGGGSAPSAPTGVTASPASGEALVSWTPPSGTVTSYTVTTYVGATAQKSVQVTAPATSTAVTGLTNGTAYTFTVTATNANGTSPASAASGAVTPEDAIFDFATPATVDSGDTSGVELGVNFTASQSGTVTGIRFYKAAANTGTHVGSLWSASGTLLASGTFTGETASGWQTLVFSSPVGITAGTDYVAGYLAPAGHYSFTGSGLSAAVTNGPLSAVASGSVSTGNGVFAYASSSTFPTNSFNAANYWVDVLFQPGGSGTPSAPTGVTAIPATGQAQVRWTAPANQGSSAITGYTVTPWAGSTAGTPVSAGASATSVNVPGLQNGTAYTFTVTANNSSGAGQASTPSSAVTPEDTIFDFAAPAASGIDSGDTSPVELGVKFMATQNGSVYGIRFYKAAANTGTHVGSLWTTGGTLLASGTFTGETASGWQTLVFSSPVSITAGTTYVAGYFAPAGHYSFTSGGFNSGVNNGPLQAQANSTTPNGVYAYSGSSTFPTSSFNATNYWVDVLFR